ncbi:Leucine rich repeat-containing protein [Prevotella communis]|uniref:Leucine rich repeat-containing protein n=1 Tax=Prevotella communis TaxID=2913614 RepID=A0A1G7T008_9BACT|nr:leucine-rich repeat protein [Prevotella communis]SDG27979.1 Leucine rich repeat-containing protein [Prevotella communis]
MMTKNKLLLLLALLMTAATGAWAQSTTHVVNQDNVNTIFSGDGYTLGDAVKAGDVLDFQGEIDLQHSLIVNKQVTIKSTTKDAVVKLNTPTYVAPNAYTATVMYPQSFVINKAGSGTTVQDIRIENTETWIFNTSNVTFTGVTMWVEDAKVGAGIGHVALRYSDNVTFDGCTVYTKNNVGSSACALTGSHDCTFKDTRFENAGNVGNILYIGNPYNIDDKPADYTMNNDNISVLNCTITAESSGGLSQFKIMDGLRHRIENCTVNFATGFGCNATASEDGHVIRNNTFTKGLSIPRASTVTGNTISGNVTISANNATVSGTTVFPGSTITGNSILGKVTFNSNSKNNTFTGNTVISSEAYAVVMAPTADANNTVTDNILLAASNAGDAAVNPSTGTGNTVSDNLSEAATGDVTWNFDATTGTLTIGGTGAMADYEQTSDGQTTAPWAFLSDKITRVIIGEGVTKVGNNAFQGCTALNDVFVKGAGTLTIGTAAFDATKTPAIYVPTGQEAAYQTAWSAYAGSIGEYMNCGADAMAVYDAATKTLTICGKGAMTDFASAADQPWKALQGQLQTVSFEPFITAIGANAFSGCSALTAANIEGTATTIADGAFDGNATGRRIFVPAQTMAGYGESAYAADIYATGQCGAEGSDVSWELSAQTMALSISGTGAMADYANANSVPWYSVRDKITSATIAAGVTSVGNYAFSNCSSMATVSIPDGVTSIGSNAFYYCAALTAINLPAGLTSIDSNAFYACSNLSNVTIPDGVTSIGDYAFRSCSKLESITLPAGLTSIGGFAFGSCSNLANITIPDGVTTIGESTFYACTALTAINIPDGVTTIGSNAFYGCSNLASVNIPDGVTSIGSYAFRNCEKLESITLPVSVTSVGSYAFRNCSMLAEVNIFAPSLQTYGSNAFRDTADGLKISVPSISLEEYKTRWSAYADKFVALPYYALTMKEGTQDADKWTVKVGDAEKTVTLPITNLKGGETVTLKYNGRLKVKGVKATSDEKATE